MVSKTPVSPARIRRIPKQFSWVGHRLVRNGHIGRFTPADGLLHLFLTTAGGSQGLSYYGDKSIMKRLSMSPGSLEGAGNHLAQLGVIAWRKPLYQVLSLDETPQPVRTLMEQPLSLDSILKQMAGGTE